MKKVILFYLLSSIVFSSITSSAPTSSDNSQVASRSDLQISSKHDVMIFSGFFIMSADGKKFEIIDVSNLDEIYHSKKTDKETCKNNLTFGLNQNQKLNFLDIKYKAKFMTYNKKLYFYGHSQEKTLMVQPSYVGSDVLQGCSISGRLMVVAEKQRHSDYLLHKAGVKP